MQAWRTSHLFCFDLMCFVLIYFPLLRFELLCLFWFDLIWFALVALTWFALIDLICFALIALIWFDWFDLVWCEWFASIDLPALVRFDLLALRCFPLHYLVFICIVSRYFWLTLFCFARFRFAMPCIVLHGLALCWEVWSASDWILWGEWEKYKGTEGRRCLHPNLRKAITLPSKA